MEKGWNEEFMRLGRKYVLNFTDIYKVYKNDNEGTEPELIAKPIL